MARDFGQFAIFLLLTIGILILGYIIVGGAIFGLKTGTALTVVIILTLLALPLSFLIKGQNWAKHNVAFALVAVVLTFFILFQLPKLVPALYSVIGFPQIAHPQTYAGFNLDSILDTAFSWSAYVWVLIGAFLIAILYSAEKR